MESLMRTLKFPLTKRSIRQIFDYDTGTAAIRFMYDSGASIPVWCSDVDFLIKAFPDAVKTGLSARITGFGTGVETADVFMIPDFELSDGNEAIHIMNLSIVVIFKPQIGCDFIMSESMLSKVDTHTLRHSTKELQIDFYKNMFVCTSKKLGGELLDIAVWMQKDICDGNCSDDRK